MTTAMLSTLQQCFVVCWIACVKDFVVTIVVTTDFVVTIVFTVVTDLLSPYLTPQLFGCTAATPGGAADPVADSTVARGSSAA